MRYVALLLISSAPCVRLIHSASINDVAEGTSYTCSIVQDAAQMVKRGRYMGKIDLSSAYRTVLIHPDDYGREGLEEILMKPICMTLGSCLVHVSVLVLSIN